MANFRKVRCVQSQPRIDQGQLCVFRPSPISFFQYFVQSNIRPAALIILLHPSVNLPSRVSEFISLHLSLRISGVRLERCQPFHPTLFSTQQNLPFLRSISGTRTLFHQLCSSVSLRRQSSAICQISQRVGHSVLQYFVSYFTARLSVRIMFTCTFMRFL